MFDFLLKHFAGRLHHFSVDAHKLLALTEWTYVIAPVDHNGGEPERPREIDSERGCSGIELDEDFVADVASFLAPGQVARLFDICLEHYSSGVTIYGGANAYAIHPDGKHSIYTLSEAVEMLELARQNPDSSFRELETFAALKE